MKSKSNLEQLGQSVLIAFNLVCIGIVIYTDIDHQNKKDNVIDFLSYLKKKRGEEEQFEEEIKDPFQLACCLKNFHF